MLLNNKILKDISHKNDLRKQEGEDFSRENAFRSAHCEFQLCMKNKNLWNREFLCMTYGDFMSKYCHIGAVFLHPWKPWLFFQIPQPAGDYNSNLESLPIQMGGGYTKGTPTPSHPDGKPLVGDYDNGLFDEPKLTMAYGENLDDLEVRHLETYAYKGYPLIKKRYIEEGFNYRQQAYLEYSFRLTFPNAYEVEKGGLRVQNPTKEFIWDKILGYYTGKSEYAQNWDDWFSSECSKKGYKSRLDSHYIENYRYGRRGDQCFILNKEAIKIIQSGFKDLPKKMLSIDYNNEKELEEVINYNVEQGKNLLRLQEEREKQKEKEEEEVEVEVEEESWYEEVESEEYLYLMKNNLNGQYKIGRSNNPSYRERTLQSQEPDVNLVAKFKGLAYLEREWHDYFNSERVRGEWFKLNSTQLNFMISKCKSSKAPPTR